MVVTLDQYSSHASDADSGMQGVATFKTRATLDAEVAEAEARRKKALTDF
jgi:uncharacterized membrane protein